MRIPFMKREKATYIKLRRLGYSINIISKMFGRSRSVIHRVLKRNGLTLKDLRKLPGRIKRLAASRQHRTMLKFFTAWEKWSLGEGERPP